MRGCVQVFLSQLHRRARLVNQAFQQHITAIVRIHQYAATDASPGKFLRASSIEAPLTEEWNAAIAAAAATADFGAGQVECIFMGGERAVVEVLPAPVKTLARMREKLTKCVFHM